MTKKLSLIYSNHRPETLALTEEEMSRHDIILLEEPAHPGFFDMLSGHLPIKEYLLDQDLEYPFFSMQQCQLLQSLYLNGKELHQVEPFLDNLLKIHEFFADGNSPAELENTTIQTEVYDREKIATAKLIDYYNMVRGDDFEAIIDAIQQFARADAERFRLRDRLRAERIAPFLEDNSSIYVEAGPMHLLLEKFLSGMLPDDWTMQTISIEEQILKDLGIEGKIFSPGDELTALYLHESKNNQEQENLLSARSLIYAKTVTKEENSDSSALYAHALNEHQVIAMVNELSFKECMKLFFKVRTLDTQSAREVIEDYIQKRKT